MGVQFRQGPGDIDLYLHQQYAARPRDAPDFHDNYTKPYAGATLAILATLTQLQHAITQFLLSLAAVAAVEQPRPGAQPLARRDGLTHTAVAANFALLLVASRTAHLQRSTVARINDQIDSICSTSSTSRHGGIWLLPLSTELTKRS